MISWPDVAMMAVIVIGIFGSLIAILYLDGRHK